MTFMTFVRRLFGSPTLERETKSPTGRRHQEQQNMHFGRVGRQEENQSLAHSSLVERSRAKETVLGNVERPPSHDVQRPDMTIQFKRNDRRCQEQRQDMRSKPIAAYGHGYDRGVKPCPPPSSAPVENRSHTSNPSRRQEQSQTGMASPSPSRSSSQVTKNTNTNKPLPPIPEPLTSAALLSTLDTFHRSLSHTRYAVSGAAALAVWGHTGVLPNRVSILCCSADREVIRTWAKVAGWYLYPSTPEVIGLPSNQQGKIRRIRLKCIDSEAAFEAQDRVSPADLLSDSKVERGESRIIPTQATVLTPTALLNHFAMQYLVHAQQWVSTGQVEHTQNARNVGRHIIWILERMNSSLQLISQLQRKRTGAIEMFIPPTGPDISRLLPYAVDKEFRARFDEQFPGAVHLWTRCGLDYSDQDDHDENWCPLQPAPLRRPSSNITNPSMSISTKAKRHGIYSYSSVSTSRSTSSPSTGSSNYGKSALATAFDATSPSLFALSEVEREHDDVALHDWQIPDDLKVMMDQAAAEYHGRDMWH